MSGTLGILFVAASVVLAAACSAGETNSPRTETAWVGETNTLRNYSGVIYDVSLALRIASHRKELDALKCPTAPPPPDSSKLGASGMYFLNQQKYQKELGEYTTKKTQLEKLISQYACYLKSGKVLSVADDGIIAQDAFFKNLKGDFVDGSVFTVIALPCGTYSYKALSGARRTIRCFDVGIPVDPITAPQVKVLPPCPER